MSKPTGKLSESQIEAAIKSNHGRIGYVKAPNKEQTEALIAELEKVIKK